MDLTAGDYVTKNLEEIMQLRLTCATLLCLTIAVCAQEPPAPPAGEPAASGMQLSVGVGAVTMDGETYQQISLRPDIPLGKFGLGLDLTLYFNSEGGIRTKENFRLIDVLDYIHYIRYGYPGDNVYLKAGALDDVTIGYGILMNHYANSVEYPAIKRLGANWELTFADFKVEGMFNSFRELVEPGLLAVRVSRPFWQRLEVGATLVADGNQYADMADSDDDEVPDELDRFPGSNDADILDWLTDLYLNDQTIYDGLREQYPEWPADPTTATPDYAPDADALAGIALDLGYPLLPNLKLYAQGAHFLGYGSGIAAPGLRWQPLQQLRLGMEYRYYTDEFIPGYFDRTYELTRYTVIEVDGNDTLQTREAGVLAVAKAAQGVYADLTFQLFNLLQGHVAYSSMHPLDEGNHTNSLYGTAGLNLTRLPKLKELSAYYYQANVRTLFRLEVDSLPIWGYRIGYEVANGVNLRLDYRYTYQDLNGDGEISGSDEQDRTFLIETYFSLR